MKETKIIVEWVNETKIILKTIIIETEEVIYEGTSLDMAQLSAVPF